MYNLNLTYYSSIILILCTSYYSQNYSGILGAALDGTLMHTLSEASLAS